MPKTSVKAVARRMTQDNQRLAKQKKISTDSFQNFVAQVGIGTDNISSGSTYGFNPITRNRILLEWIHRGSWAGGLGVDVIADDMTRAGVRILGDLDPELIEKINDQVTKLGLWDTLNDATRSARLYGGSVMIPLIDGQDMSQPFRPDLITKGQLKGFLALDRWQVDPTLEDLVQDFGPNFGLPKYYRVNSDSPGLRGQKVHYTRVLRQIGDRLPYWQRVMENLWGTSVYERMYDRLVAFDSSTQGAAQLIYKAWLRTLKIDGLREIVSSGGAKMAGLAKYVDMFRRFQAFEGVTMIDAKDDLGTTEVGAFGGLADAMHEFASQLAGALQVPLTRLLGQSPGGLNATGESDMRNYYDGILQRQNACYLVPLTSWYRSIAISIGIEVGDGFKIEFNPLWQMDEVQKSEVAARDITTITTALEASIIDPATAMEELKQLSDKTGRFTNISAEHIEEARNAEINPPNAGDLPATQAALAMLGRGDPQRPLPSTTDHTNAAAELARKYGLQIVIENPKGTIRQGVTLKTGEPWSIRMPADYGYIRCVDGADGDQLDCYVGPSPKSDKAWVVHQYDPDTGTYDEDKVFLGFKRQGEALQCYFAGHSRAAQAFGSIEPISLDDLRSRIDPSQALQVV
jgi:uncharacterized protein